MESRAIAALPPNYLHGMDVSQYRIPNALWDISGVYAHLTNFQYPTTWPPNSVYSIKANLEFSFLNYTHDGLCFLYDEDGNILKDAAGASLYKDLFDGMAEFVWYFNSRFYIDVVIGGVKISALEINAFTQGVNNVRIGSFPVQIDIPAQYRLGRKELKLRVQALIAYKYRNYSPSDNCWHTILGYWRGDCACALGGDYCSASFKLEKPSVDIFEIGADITPPTADFVVSGTPPFIAPVTLNFDASTSTPGAAPIKEYRWDFGDSSTMNTQNPYSQHVYKSPGAFNVKLTVVTDIGQNTKTKAVAIDAALADIFFKAGDCYFPSGVKITDVITPTLILKNQGGPSSATVKSESGGKTQTVWTGNVPGYNTNFPLAVQGHTIDWYTGYKPADGSYVSVDFILLMPDGSEADRISYTLKVGESTTPTPTPTPTPTGGASKWPIYVGAGLIVVGGAALVARRRRT